MRARGATFCGPRPSVHLDSGISHEHSKMLTSDEPTKITMKTRVAVRDKNPHRFQVVALRDAGKMRSSRFLADTARPLRVPTSPISHLLRSPSGTLPPCSPTRPLRASVSAQSLTRKESRYLQEVNDLNANKSATPSASRSLIASSSFLSSMKSHGQLDKVSPFSEIDLNRSTAQSSKRCFDPSTAGLKGGSRPVLGTGNVAAASQPKRIKDLDLNGRTLTRSLHFRAHHDKSHAKSTSLSNLPSPQTPRRKVTTDSMATNRQHSINDNTTPKKYILRGPENDWLSSPETPTLVKKSLSKKRHAIYTSSLVLPDFDKLAFSMGDTTVRHASDSFSATEWDKRSLCLPLQSNSGRLTRTPRRECEEVCLVTMQATSESVIGKPLEAGLKACNESPRHGICGTQNSSASLSSLPTLTDARSASLQAKFDAESGRAIYPQIIIELFSQIDQDIEDWSKLLVLK